MVLESVLFFFIGAVLGSFLNVVAMRSIDGRNWVTGRSECDSCHHKLSALDMIPIFSFLVNKGRCRYCHKKIPIQHFLSEFLLGLIFLCVYLFLDYSIEDKIELLFIISILWVNVISDLMDFTTITKVLYFGIFTDYIYNLIKYGFDYLNIISGICIIIVILLNYILNKKDTKFGLGDLDVLLLLVVYNGLYFSALSLMIGSFVAIVYMIPLYIQKKVTKKSRIPLVPFIFLGMFGGIIFNVIH